QAGPIGLSPTSSDSAKKRLRGTSPTSSTSSTCPVARLRRRTPSSTVSSSTLHRNTHRRRSPRCAVRSMRPHPVVYYDGGGEVSMGQEHVQETFHTIVIGGGQGGLSVGYYLARQGRPFVILDASQRVGDSWRQRWDSLRLFTPAVFDSLVGMKFPAPAFSFPTKDEMGDYLEAYARRFQLPIRNGIRVDRLTRVGNRYLIEAGAHRFEAEHVVVAMSSYQVPRVPAFAKELGPDILQLHSSEYRNLRQLKSGGVLLVGAGNSGAEIAIEVAREHQTWVSGRDTGHVPFRIDGPVARLFLT